MSLDQRLNRRIFLGGIAASAMTAILAACGGSSSATETSKPAASTGAVPIATTGGGAPAATTGASAATSTPAKVSGGPIQLQFWASVRGGTEFIAASQALCKQFSDKNPGITVTWTGIPSQGWYEKYTTAIGSGTAPDISTGTAYQAWQFYDTKNILPLDDIVKEWQGNGTIDGFLPNTVNLMQYDGHTVALPWAFDIRIPYYRKDLFQQAGLQVPTSWDEWRAAAKKITKGDVYGMVISGDTLGWQSFAHFMLGNGGGIFTPDKKVNLANDPRNVEAAQMIANMVKDGSINPAGPGYVNDDAYKSFTTGKAGMFIGNPLIEVRFPDVAEKIGIVPPYPGPHGDKGTVFWVNNAMIFNSTKHPDEAKAFLKWWTLNNKPLWTEGHVQTLPVLKSLVDDPGVVKNNANAVNIIQNWLPAGLPIGTHSQTLFPQLNTIEGDGTLITLIQDLEQGKSAADSLKKADDAFKKVVG